MKAVSGGTGIGASWAFDDAGRRTGGELANGVESLFDMDVDGRLTHLEYGKDGTSLYEVDYGYDAVGNRTYTRDAVQADRSELYSHDQRHRLARMQRGTLNAEGTAVTAPLADANQPSDQRWDQDNGLDRRGNWLDFRQTINGQPQVQQTRTVNDVNEYLTIDAYTLQYDPNGNLTQDPSAKNAGDTTPTGQKYEYDEENRLTRVKRASDDATLLEIRYDAFGRRVKSIEYLDATTGQILATPRTTKHVVAGAMTIQDYTVSGETASLAKEYLWGRQFPEPVAMIVYSGTSQAVYHYLRDILGNVVGLTNSAGAIVETYRYDPYGKTYIYNATGTLLSASAVGNPYGFTSQRYDAAVKLYHFWYRTYSTSLGRWIQRDPAGYVDGVCLYEYAKSDPAQYIDPNGLACWMIPVRFAINYLYGEGGSKDPEHNVDAGISGLEFQTTLFDMYDGIYKWADDISYKYNVGPGTMPRPYLPIGYKEPLPPSYPPPLFNPPNPYPNPYQYGEWGYLIR